MHGERDKDPVQVAGTTRARTPHGNLDPFRRAATHWDTVSAQHAAEEAFASGQTDR
jgi:hypothetical protein